MTSAFPVRYALEGLDEDFQVLLLTPPAKNVNLYTTDQRERRHDSQQEPLLGASRAGHSTELNGHEIKRDVSVQGLVGVPHLDGDDDIGEELDAVGHQIVTELVKQITLRYREGNRNEQLGNQQNAAALANQKLQATEKKLDETLAAEVVACNDRLLATFTEAEHFCDELTSLETRVRSLHSSLGCLQLRYSSPLDVLSSRICILRRFDEALTCLTLIKQFSHLVRLFETQFRKNSSASQVPDTQHGIVETKQQGMNDYCLLHIKSAAELHFEICVVLKQLASYCHCSESPENRLNENVVSELDSSADALRNAFPCLEADIRWIQTSGRAIIHTASRLLSQGFSDVNIEALTTGCEALLCYDGSTPSLLIQRLTLEVEQLVRSTTNVFNSKSINNAGTVPSDSSNRYNLAALSKKNIPSAATLAKEKETRFWEELEVFFKALKHAMSVAFQLDAVLKAQCKKPKSLSSLSHACLRNTKSSVYEDICKALKSSLVSAGKDLNSEDNTISLNIPHIIWTTCLAGFRTEFLSLIKQRTLGSFLTTECPKILNSCVVAGMDIRDCMLPRYTTADPVKHVFNASAGVFHSCKKVYMLPNASDGRVVDSELQDTKYLSLGDFPLSSLPDIVSPIVKTYLSDVEKSIFTLVSLMFPTLSDQEKNSANQALGGHHEIALSLPTPSDIRTFVNVLSEALRKAEPCGVLFDQVLRIVETALTACATRLVELSDIASISLAMPENKARNEDPLPFCTAGHQKNARLSEVGYLLGVELLDAFKVKRDTVDWAYSLERLKNSTTTSSLFLPEVKRLESVFLHLQNVTDRLVSDWFSSLERYICDVNLFLLVAILSDPKNLGERQNDTLLPGDEVIRRIHRMTHHMRRKFFSLLPDKMYQAYGLVVARRVLNFYLATSCMIKPLWSKLQCEALRTHGTSLLRILATCLSPKLETRLGTEVAQLQTLQTLFQHFTESADVPEPFPDGVTEPHVEPNMFSSPYRLLVGLHLLSRFTDKQVPGLPSFFHWDGSLLPLLWQVATALASAQEQLTSCHWPDIQSDANAASLKVSSCELLPALKTIVATHTTAEGRLINAQPGDHIPTQLVYSLRKTVLSMY